MLNKEIIRLMAQLAKDIADFVHVHPNIQESIAMWILQDRKTPKSKKADT